MPNIANLKPVIKITEKQFKELLQRVLNEKGRIKPSALEKPILGESAIGRTEVVNRPSSFQRFENPSAGQGMYPNPYAQPELPSITSPQGTQRVGQQVPPTSSDLILNRVISQQRGPSAIDDLQGAMEPVDRTMGRLYSEVEGGRIPKDYPWEEARMKALSDSSLIPENSPRIPTALKMSATPEGLAYERLNWKGIEPISERQTKQIVVQAAQEAGVNITKKEASDIAVVFNDIWQSQGGGRSAEGKMWENLRSQSRLKDKSPNAKDYFIRSAESWRRDPNTFRRQFPRETKHIEENWTNYMNGRQ